MFKISSTKSFIANSETNARRSATFRISVVNPSGRKRGADLSPRPVTVTASAALHVPRTEAVMSDWDWRPADSPAEAWAERKRGRCLAPAFSWLHAVDAYQARWIS